MTNFDLKILCVDDCKEILDGFADLIHEVGFIPLIADNAAEAVRLFYENKSELALIICDLQMPKTNGFELRSQLIPDALDVPFIIVSAHITTELVLEAIDLKIDGFYHKPFGQEEIKAAVAKHTKMRIESIRETQIIESVFIEEATNLTDDMEFALLALDLDRNNVDLINNLFRCAHTIKGSSGVLTTDIITRYVHRYEDIISSIKDHKLEFSDSIYEILLRGFDRIKNLIVLASEKKLKDQNLHDLLRELNIAETESSHAIKSAAKEIKSNVTTTRKNAIPVPIDILEKLSDCSGEITVIRNMVNKLVKSIEQERSDNKDVQSLGELLNEMHKVNGTVQNYITDLRKMPFNMALKTIPRLVRDLGKELNKKILLKTDNDALRVDNTLVSGISNILVHLVRNSADHGIEDIETRVNQGKAEAGTVNISCKEIGDEIHVIIKDDGRGINLDRIRRKALEKGLFSELELDAMSPSQMRSIIFSAGFSTAERVTDVSGRGVGMDMVKTSVEALGGSIKIDSEIGRGTTFTLTFPVPKSVLIITSLIVESRSQKFAIPQDAIKRVLHLDQTTAANAIRMASLGKTLNVDNVIYPLISLAQILSLSSTLDDFNASIKQESISIVVVRAENTDYALIVDKIHDSEEIVVKRINSYFNQQSAFLGSTFMGDGSVSLVLDISGIAKLAGFTLSGATIIDSAEEGKNTSKNVEGESLLLWVHYPLFDNITY